MTEFQDPLIDYFQSLTGLSNRQDIIRFLDLYEWNLDFAIDAWFTNNDEHRDDQPNITTTQRMDSNDTKLDNSLSNRRSLQQRTSFENQLQRTSGRSSMGSSQHLFNTLSHRLTSIDTNQFEATSNTPSFHDQVEELLVSNVRTTSPIFPDINQFDHNKQQLLQYIDSNIIGKNLQVNTPWGTRKIIYADYAASGRGVTFIEYYMLTNVLPYYASTQDGNNACAVQTKKFRESARAIIKRCVNATDADAIIFTGSGSTAAIHKLVDVLNLKDEKIRSKMVVFISAFEHVANILPWKETGVEVVHIPNNKEGLINQHALEEQLKYCHNQLKKHVICTFNAASDITGIRTDVDIISTLVHQYNGWIFWDYSAAAPYVKIDMNPSNTAYKDAIFISTHKFVGGPSTPGILIAKKNLFTNQVPCGGGESSVNFITRTNVEYVKDIETREEGGTPNILGAIRAGLVFHLKEAVGCRTIETRQNELMKKFFSRFHNHPTLVVLGPPTVNRLAIVSFIIRVPSFAKYLHPNFVCVLLNDLFGIQVRSGWLCAGPYILDLLNIDEQKANIYTKFLIEDGKRRPNAMPKNQLMQPGVTRFNLPYFSSNEEVDYIFDALDFVASNGWKFLPLYTYDLNTAIWRARTMPSETNFHQLHSLRMINFTNGTMQENRSNQIDELLNSNFNNLIIHSSSNDPVKDANALLNNIPKYINENIAILTDPPLNIPEEYKDLIWFVTPKEVIPYMTIDVGQQHDSHRTLVKPPSSINNK